VSRGWLSETQLNLLHDASLRILAGTGVRFFCREALEMFRRAGAQVSDDTLVRIPHGLVEQALKSAPRAITIFDRDGSPAMRLGEGGCHVGTGSDCAFIWDPATGARRKAVLADVVDGVRLVDGLPGLDFLMSMFLPSDVPASRYERCQLKAMLEESTKPIVFCGIEEASTRWAVQMAAEAAGGPDALGERPFVLNYINTVSALRHNEESVQRLLYAAARGIPTIYAPANCRGTTAPMSVAGMMALGNAGQLAGLVLSQFAREGSPFILNHPSVGAMDWRWMRDLFVSPDKGPAGCELAARYGLPVFTSGGCSDSKLFDAQAAAEAALSLFAAMASGASMVQNAGYLDSATTGSLELMALVSEMAGWLRRYLRDVEVSEETLAVDLIGQVGPDGDFLATEHTARHLREDWLPALFDRAGFEAWEEQGRQTLEQRAGARVRELVGGHRARPLPQRVRDALSAMVEAERPS
jgi:trimethylamine---corrinoid protein Co-methyltransferase